MAFSKIVLTFTNWDSGSPIGSTILFQVDAVAKNETVVSVRSSPGQVSWIAANHLMAQSFVDAWTADYAGVNFTLNRVSNVVTITAAYDGAVFSGFSFSGPGPGNVAAVITNEAFDFPLNILTAVVEAADSAECTTVKVTLTVENGTPPYAWNTILPGNVGLIGANVPRSGGNITVELEDDDAEIDSIIVAVPQILTVADIAGIVIEGDPSGLFGTVTITMGPTVGAPLTFEYSLDGVTYSSDNVFTSVLVGSYTLYVRDNYGCVITQAFDVELESIRPPAYYAIPRSNSFGWHLQQAAVNDCTNPYNGTNAKPNDYKPTRFYNPRYFQPWCPTDNPITQFRSNYDTLSATLIKIVDDSIVGTFPITQHSSNLGQRQIMDAKIYDRGAGQTGVYWDSGNIYDTDGVTVIDTHNLDGQLPEWARVGQVFTLSGSATDGLFEIVQIIYDSVLLVNAAVIDRVYADVAEPTSVKTDAVYNRLNYETYEFQADLDIAEGCYKILLVMEDSEEEYPTLTFETLPFIVSTGNRDMVLMESSDHVDDGILYSTGITHKQRFQGLFYEEDYPSSYETSRDSRKSLNKLDGRVQKSFVVEAIDVPHWVHEKLALLISKKNILINNLQVQFEEPWEKERQNQYSRVNLKAEAFVAGYEQYLTNAYDIL
jgi:hypothetical protein